MSVSRGRDAERAGVGDRFAQKIHQSVVDARVFDARRSEKKLHDAWCLVVRRKRGMFVAVWQNTGNDCSRIGSWNVTLDRGAIAFSDTGCLTNEANRRDDGQRAAPRRSVRVERGVRRQSTCVEAAQHR